ncbi:putative phage abortive infection protein [Vibrio owensii]|uniref:putative phage abortive infection protein n=1 Tax=Vibrio owensii TaxID=696485 RepID=UPI0038CE27C8
MNLKELEKKITQSKYIALVIIAIIPLGYLAWFWGINDYELSKDVSNWGVFGDFIGGILNPLIALLAFYWLTMSVLIQKTELSETQQILNQTLNSQLEQSLTQKQKRFEDSFYALLEQMNNVYQQLLTVPDENKKINSNLNHLARDILTYSYNNPLEMKSTKMRSSNHECNHLFRLIYQLLKFVYSYHHELDAKCTIKSEKFYTNILRSFIDKNTLVLLAVNCVKSSEPDDFEKYRFLIERYELLEHFEFSDVWQERLIEMYSPRAFGANVIAYELSHTMALRENTNFGS